MKEERSEKEVVDKGDRNVAGTDGGEDDVRDCEAADYSDWQVQNVDTEQHEHLAAQQAQHAPHLLHQGTFPLADVCASNADPRWAERALQTDVATERSTRSSVISDESKS